MADRMRIKELADLLGVSKTAVRNYIDENFRGNYMERDENGVFTITSEGCKLLAALMGRSDKLPQQTENTFSETDANSENITIPRSVFNFMEQQIAHLQAELAKEREHSRMQAERATQLADQAQRLHSGSLQIGAPRKRFLSGWFKKEDNE